MTGIFRSLVGEFTGANFTRRVAKSNRESYEMLLEQYRRTSNVRDQAAQILESQIRDIQNIKPLEPLRKVDTSGQERYRSRGEVLENVSRSLASEGSSLQGMGTKIKERAADYGSRYKNYLGDVGALSKKRESLQSELESFKQKAPALEQKIREYEGISQSFEDAYKQALQKKESLKGLTAEDVDVRQVKEFEENVENLRSRRVQAERDIKEQLNAITFEHEGLQSGKKRLQQGMQDYQRMELGLKYKGQELSGLRGAIQSEIGRLKSLEQEHKGRVSRHEGDIMSYDKEGKRLVEEEKQYMKEREQYIEKQKRFAEEYNAKRSRAEGQAAHIRSLDARVAQDRADVESRGRIYEKLSGEYREQARMTNLFSGVLEAGTGMLLGGLATGGLAKLGAPAAIAQGAGGAIKLGGLIKGLSTATSIPKIANLSDFQGRGAETGLKAGLGTGLGEKYLGKTISYTPTSKYTPISSGYLGTEPKVNVPELGNLPQSLEHFGMPMLPKLSQLPKLHEALGKMVTEQDIKGLTLGLPRMTSGKGKTYTSAVLYDPSFLKKLKRVSRAAGKPYLKEMRYA